MRGARSLRAAWVHDERRHERLNAEGRNYWNAYTAEILSRLGVTADVLPPSALGQASRLAGYSLLFLGRMSAAELPSGAGSVLDEWVKAGGTLVAFAAEGLDELFGIRAEGWLDQPEGELGIAGYLRLAPVPLTTDIHADAFPDQPLIIVSPVRLVRATESEVVATLLRPDPEQPGKGRAAHATANAAISQRALGRGWAFYFAFDVAQTMWAIHQGKPVDADHDGDGYLRSMDARVIRENESTVGYTDELHFLLENMVGQQPMPLIHPIPPVDGEVADALFFIGGDDEGDPKHQVAASDFMRSRGLPYHINLMPVDGRFVVSREEIEHIEANGHELSLHYDFINEFQHPTGFTEDDVRKQAELFRKTFGRPAVCSVNHWCRWAGWAEPARWMRSVGQLGDNSWIGIPSPPLNPVNNIDLSFGTAFPRHVWDDWRHGNERLDFVQEHIVCYEIGYLGEETRFDVLHRAVDLAAKYRLTMDLFHHPVYLATYPACQKAIDELLRYTEERGMRPGFMGNDELARWWARRAEARIGEAQADGGRVAFRARCEYPGGFVAKVCLGPASAAACTVSGAPAEVRVISQFGRRWAYIPLPPGEHEVLLTLTP
jgi:hypothetical protein